MDNNLRTQVFVLDNAPWIEQGKTNNIWQTIKDKLKDKHIILPKMASDWLEMENLISSIVIDLKKKSDKSPRYDVPVNVFVCKEHSLANDLAYNNDKLKKEDIMMLHEILDSVDGTDIVDIERLWNENHFGPLVIHYISTTHNCMLDEKYISRYIEIIKKQIAI